MIGLILYEAADLVYNITKITYNGARGIYYWYYGLEYPEQLELKNREERIIELTQRIKHLEELQHNTKLEDQHTEETQIEETQTE